MCPAHFTEAPCPCVCGPAAESHALGPGRQARLAHFHPSPLSHALAPGPQVFLLLQSGPHTILPRALLSRPGLTVWARRSHPDAGETLCPGKVCGPQDHHLGVKVPQERAGALPCRAGCGAPCLSCVGIVHTRIRHPSRRSLIAGSDSGLLPEGIRDTRRVLHGGGKTERKYVFKCVDVLVESSFRFTERLSRTSRACIPAPRKAL